MTERFFIKKYIVRNACLIYGIVISIILIFSIALLFSNVMPKDFRDSILIPFALGTLIFVISLIPIIRFLVMIRRQEVMFQIRFCENSAIPLHHNSLVYRSSDWLIIAGQYAFYRSYLKSNRIKIHVQHTSRGNNYLIKLDGIDDRPYCFHVDSASTAKEIKAWSNENTTDVPVIDR